MSIALYQIVGKFNEIEPTDYLGKIKFYEENSSLIFSLNRREYSFFTYQYVLALFEMGKYDHLLAEIDELIEYVFIHNVSYRPKGTFEDLLFKKASSFHHTCRYPEAILITEQLVRMDLQNSIYHRLLGSSYFKLAQQSSSSVRLLSIVLIFCSAILSAIFWFASGRLAFIGPDLKGLMFILSPAMLALCILGGVWLKNKIQSYLKVNALLR